MRNFFFGFFVATTLCLAGYLVWEQYRHVAVLIQKQMVPVPVPMGNIQPEPMSPEPIKAD